MKLAIGVCVLLGFFAFASARAVVPTEEDPDHERDWYIIPDMQNHLHFVNGHQPTPRTIVADGEITFYYYSRHTKQFAFKVDTVDDIVFTDFDPKRKTMFIIHGWTSNGKSEMNDLITAALLKVDDWNVFNIDWSGPASKNYLSAKGAIPAVGSIVARFIEKLCAKSNLKMDHVYITGHSLGGQIAGRTGATLKGEAAFIVGLDPAMPLFSYVNMEDRLDPSDAKHVQVIHTNGGFLGFFKPLGHADFYPNGGKSQKGCGVDMFGMCAHIRAYIYFAESIVSGEFLSHSCPTYNDYQMGECFDNHFAHMGGNTLDTSAKGVYYLATSAAEPFALA